MGERDGVVMNAVSEEDGVGTIKVGPSRWYKVVERGSVLVSCGGDGMVDSHVMVERGGLVMSAKNEEEGVGTIKGGGIR